MIPFKYKYFPFILLLLYAVFVCLMIQLTLQYIPLKSDVAFLQIKQNEVLNVKGYLIIFYIHVYSSIFVLLAAFTQFSPQILQQNKKLHRKFGWIYFIVVICLSAPSGIFMGCYANGAWHSRVSFVLLGLLWEYFTISAFVSIKQNNVVKHRQFMIRSFALALSAISLRTWKMIIVLSLHTAPMDTYQIIAWLGWVPNLLIAEYIIRRKNIE